MPIDYSRYLPIEMADKWQLAGFVNGTEANSSGSYGVVMVGKSKCPQRYPDCVIKFMNDEFRRGSPTERGSMTREMYDREVAVLMYIKEHIHDVNKVNYMEKRDAFSEFYEGRVTAERSDGTIDCVFACEHLRGNDLCNALMQRVPQPNEFEIKELLHPVFVAVSKLHDMKILHLDLKLENIVFRDKPRADGTFSEAVIVDYGLAYQQRWPGEYLYPIRLSRAVNYYPKEVKQRLQGFKTTFIERSCIHPAAGELKVGDRVFVREPLNECQSLDVMQGLPIAPPIDHPSRYYPGKIVALHHDTNHLYRTTFDVEYDDQLLTPGVDVYSLGYMLFKIFTGKRDRPKYSWLDECVDDEFTSISWCHSQQLKELIKGMLRPEVSQRLTMKQVLESEWWKMAHPQLSAPVWPLVINHMTTKDDAQMSILIDQIRQHDQVVINPKFHSMMAKIQERKYKVLHGLAGQVKKICEDPARAHLARPGLTPLEFKAALEFVGFSWLVADTDSPLYSYCDFDDSHAIDYREFTIMLSGTGVFTRDEILRHFTFQIIDKNSDGKVDYHELAAHLGSMVLAKMQDEAVLPKSLSSSSSSSSPSASARGGAGGAPLQPPFQCSMPVNAKLGETALNSIFDLMSVVTPQGERFITPSSFVHFQRTHNASTNPAIRIAYEHIFSFMRLRDSDDATARIVSFVGRDAGSAGGSAGPVMPSAGPVMPVSAGPVMPVAGGTGAKKRKNR